MSKYDSPIYDECKRWIERKYENGVTWKKIEMDDKQSLSKLSEFLTIQKEINDWPKSMETDDWLKIVEERKEYEKKQQELTIKSMSAALFDENQDNGIHKPENERSSWQLYIKHLKDEKWKDESIESIEHATLGIMRRLSDDTTKTGPIKGLVIGRVQSGKTANMEAVMAMAADYGWNMFIVLSGTIENLRLQTQKRMQRDLTQEGNIIWTGLDHLSKKSPYGQRAQDLYFHRGSSMRYFTVCLKNPSRLKNLIEWIQEDRASHELMKILIIDDEVDQASVNTKAAKQERTKINDLIVHLVEDIALKNESKGNAKSINYIMYTATPYANFLNESTPESLYPKNFIWSLETSNEYIGPEQIFGVQELDEDDGLDIKREIPVDDLTIVNQIYKGAADNLPESFKEAAYWFMSSVAAMRYLGYKKPISMLVHTSQKQVNHEALAIMIEKWINEQRNTPKFHNECKRVYEQEIATFTRKDFFHGMKGYCENEKQIIDYPEYNKIVSYIDILLDQNVKHIEMNEEGDLVYSSGLHLVIDNCANNGITDDNLHMRLAYPDVDKEPYPSPAPAFVIVGGGTLSRGLTIEGLVCTYFLRAACQADTLMQMGRWFGYRKGYELIPRIWMTKDTINKFIFLSQLEVDLRNDLKKYMVAGIKPIEYGPLILNSPKVSWLKITSKNKMANAEKAGMDFSGAHPQTVIFDNVESIQKNNIKITEDFLQELSTPNNASIPNAILWKNVDLSKIIDLLLINKFQFSSRSRVFNEIEAFCDWIEDMKDKTDLASWNVIVAGKNNVEKGELSAEQRWNINGWNVGKIVRSKRKTDDETFIDIGTLRSLKDSLADVGRQYFEGVDVTNQSTLDAIRKKAGKDKTPQLLIYRIDKDSQAKNKGINSKRQDLKAVSDIIGLYISIPGEITNKDYSKYLTIKLPEKDVEDALED